MRLHNSLTNKTEELMPLKAGEISFYSCGPTVYDHAHIGNFRTYIVEDVLRRALRAQSYEVHHVMNITDVDDKTIARSRREYPDLEPLAALNELTSRYEKIFLADAKQLGIDLSKSKLVRATEHISEMQDLINQIANKYAADDGVYFDIEQFSDYGRLVKLERDHNRHRIDNDEYDKEHVADFALWKKQKVGEPAWQFEIDGRKLPGHPGWHIECSAMSVKYLGQPFDLHSGGVDLKFPHHENEIAQSKAASGQELANVFMHVEHLLVAGHKMSKSLNNFYTLNDLTGKELDPLAFRLLVQQAHYRSQLNFTWESLTAAAQNLKDLRAWADRVHQPSVLAHSSVAEVKEFKDRVINALNDDLNTPTALAQLNGLADKSNPSKELLHYLDDLFGFAFGEQPDIDEPQKAIIAKREAARQNQDWQTADILRAELNKQSIEVKDTDEGPIWSRL